MVEDSAGNVYIADYYAECVREVLASTGNITTYAGTCDTAGTPSNGQTPSQALLSGPSQLAFDYSGNLYINQYDGQQVWYVAGADSPTLAPPIPPTITNVPASSTVGAVLHGHGQHRR